MLKQILGEKTGLVLEVKPQRPVLCTGKSVKAELCALNSTEYDMCLDLSLNMPYGVSADKKETDIVVAAQGKTVFYLSFSLPKDGKMFFGEGIIEIKVRDRVLEWENVYELEFACEMAFKCGEKNDFSATEQMLVTDNMKVWLDDNENCCFQIAIEKKMAVTLAFDEKTGFEVWLNGEKIVASDYNCIELTLEEGLNKLCIAAQKGGYFWFCTSDGGERISLNTVNPKYFM